MIKSAFEIVVVKFGGTSLATPERVKEAAQKIVPLTEAGMEVVVVVSAMGATTDELTALAQSVSEQPSARELSVLLATGEQVSASVLVMALETSGVKAISLTGRQAGVFTGGGHLKAKIASIDNSRILSELSAGKVVVVAGFQGQGEDDDITTLGRGGSDTSAVALAAALKAKLCEIYTDVDGVYTADPRIVPQASKVETISYAEMLELAAAGSGVLQPRSVEVARKHQVPVKVLSVFKQSDDKTNGTLVQEDHIEGSVVVGIAVDKLDARVVIRDVPDRVGISAELFGEIADAGINVDIIEQNSSRDGLTDITFTSPQADISKVKSIIEHASSVIGAKSVEYDTSVAKISVVGAGMKTNPGVAARVFRVLAAENVNIIIISTSSIRLSVVVDEADAAKGARALHTEFGLDGEVFFTDTLTPAEQAKKAQKGR